MLDILGGQVTITSGARTTFTTNGTLVNLLPSAYDINTGAVDLAYPAFAKDCAYYYQGFNDGTTAAEFAQSFTSIPPADWNNFGAPIVLGAVPSPEVDFIDVQVNLSRIVNPSIMYNAAVPKVLPENVWIDMGGGSAACEMAFGMSRSFSAVVQAGQAVVLMQQSFMGPPNGWKTTNGGDINDGGHGWSFNGQRATPVQEIAVYGPSTVVARTRFRLGSNHLAYSDSSNFASTWRAYFKIAFGRKS